jgi:hypothetical protein
VYLSLGDSKASVSRTLRNVQLHVLPDLDPPQLYTSLGDSEASVSRALRNVQLHVLPDLDPLQL